MLTLWYKFQVLAPCHQHTGEVFVSFASKARVCFFHHGIIAADFPFLDLAKSRTGFDEVNDVDGGGEFFETLQALSLIQEELEVSFFPSQRWLCVMNVSAYHTRNTSSISVPRPGPSSTISTPLPLPPPQPGLPCAIHSATIHIPINSPNT